MKIAFLSSLNPYNIINWSGTLFYIFRSLQKTHDVEWVGGNIFEKVENMHYLQYEGMPFLPELYAPYFAELISDLLNKGDEYDIIIARDCVFIAYLTVNTPIIFIGDTTFDLIKEWWGIKDKNVMSLKDDIEKKAFFNCDYIIFSSEWAKANAISHYGLSASKIEVIEFGANLDKIPVGNNVNNIDLTTCNLLFIGKNWENKGGVKTHETYKLLKKSHKCTLTVIGSNPQLDTSDHDITIVPYINKFIKQDVELFNQIIQNSHFLLLPTKFDCFGIVFCEASAYGTPSITADVGGVSQVVKDGKNGYLLPSDATALDYAELIESIFKNKTKYNDLRMSSRKEFEDRLNWDVWSKKMNILLKQFEKEENNKHIYSNELDFYIPVYVINLSNRKDRRKHIEKQFENKKEFKFRFIEAITHPISAVEYWKSLREVIRIASEKNDEIIIFCEDDHTFSLSYNKDELFRSIIEAERMDVEILLGWSY